MAIGERAYKQLQLHLATGSLERRHQMDANGFKRECFWHHSEPQRRLVKVVTIRSGDQDPWLHGLPEKSDIRCFLSCLKTV